MVHMLMCPPDFYGIEYEINPWMSRERQVDHALAIQQWRALKDIFISLGAKISQLEPVPGLPDLVFTANAAMIYRQRAILSQFRHTQRQGEESHYAKVLASNQFEVVHLPDNMYFEGAGDALFCGDTLFAGYRRRSDVRAHQEVAQRINCLVIPLELVDPYYYHLDTCFCPLSGSQSIYFPGAFDSYGRQAMSEVVEELIEVSAEEAASFACNAVVIAKHVVTNTGCPQLHQALRAHGYEPIETPLSEFVKAGGSAKCLTLRLDGEEAAMWKTLSQS